MHVSAGPTRRRCWHPATGDHSLPRGAVKNQSACQRASGAGRRHVGVGPSRPVTFGPQCDRESRAWPSAGAGAGTGTGTGRARRQRGIAHAANGAIVHGQGGRCARSTDSPYRDSRQEQAGRGTGRDYLMASVALGTWRGARGKGRPSLHIPRAVILPPCRLSFSRSSSRSRSRSRSRSDSRSLTLDPSPIVYSSPLLSSFSIHHPPLDS